MRNFSIRDTIWRKKGHELDEIAQNILEKDREFILIGKKHEIEDFCNKHDVSSRIIRTVFSDTEKQDEAADSIPADRKAIIINASYDRNEYTASRRIWEVRGYRENISFFQAEVFGMIWDVYYSDRICLDRVEVFVTSYCTLNCEKCISYMPYFKERIHIPLKQLKEDADLLFQNVDYVHKMKILGGEGLLYPELKVYIQYLNNNYGNKIGNIRIGTNGTIIPSKDILDVCREYKVIMDISNYSAAVPERCKLDEVIKICKDNGVATDIKRTGEHWLDLGFPAEKAHYENQEEIREHFFQCAMFCRQFGEGKYWYCCSNFAAVKCGLFPGDANDYMDFRKTFTKKELLEFELGYSSIGRTTFCSVCHGCSDEANSRYIEVAKQRDGKDG